MKYAALAFALLLAADRAGAATIFPMEPGTTWRYQGVEESGGVGYSPTQVTEVVMQIVGQETFEKKELLRLETRSGGAVAREELIEVAGDGSVTCWARGENDALITKLVSPETVVPKKLKAGESWEIDSEFSGAKLHLRFSIAGEENIVVPAGSFRAFHFHAANSALMSVTMDRWFVPEIGFVKEITEARGPSGGMLQRSTRLLTSKPGVQPIPTPIPTATPNATPSPALTTPPPLDLSIAPSSLPTAPATATPAETEPEVETAPSPESSPAQDATSGPTEKRITAEISDEPKAGSKMLFSSDAPKIYVRWQGHDLPENARIRVAWVTEDVGDLIEPNFVIDETETIAPTPDASARFTLSRPTDGWAEGKYRLEIYVNDELAETLHVRIK